MLNIAYGMNKNYEKWFTLSLHSVLKHNKDVHVFAYSRDEDSLIKKLKLFRKAYKNLEYTVIPASKVDKLIDQFPTEACGYKHVQKEAFFRLFLPTLLPTVKKIMYFDCDILNYKCLDELWNADMEGKSMLGCRSWIPGDPQAKELGNEFYILSGMLVMDLERLRKIKFLKTITENYAVSLSKPQVPSADETILNDLFYNEIKIVHHKYNYCYSRGYGERSIPFSHVVNLHICGADKTPMRELFLKNH